MKAIRTAVAAAILALSVVHTAPAAVITNGSFETGDFTGWIATDLAIPFFPLSVQTLGSANTFGWPWSSTPTDGAFTAFSGFDGAGPGTISIAQDIGVVDGSSHRLRFDYRAAWDLFCSACSNRLFDVFVEPAGGGAPLGTFNLITAVAGTTVNDTGALSGDVDLSPFLGQNVRLAFVLNVPDSFSGPAQFQLDNISVRVPEPASLALLGIALAGLGCSRRKLH